MSKVPIDGQLARAIRQLHRDYPYLGEAGIGKLLENEGIEIDHHELREFMEKHNLHAEPQATWHNSADPIAALRAMLLVPSPGEELIKMPGGKNK